MHRIPLRTAAIAGSCVVALSFLTVPAFADDTASDPGSVVVGSGTVPTDDSSADPTATDDDGVDVLDDSGDSADDPSDDSSRNAAPAPTAPAAPAPEPAENGHPEQDFAQTVFTPKEIAKKGLRVRYTGLTAGGHYQPYFSTGRSGGELGPERTASKRGTISFRYRFDRTEKRSFGALGAEYTVGLLGRDTDLRLTRTVSVEYDSILTWRPAKRHGREVDLAVSVERRSASGSVKDWRGADVGFQRRTGGRWVLVETVRTNAKGVARATVKGGVSAWRAVLDDSRTVAGDATKAHHE